MNDTLTASPACLALIRRSEGFSTDAYWDRDGWAIGYGHHGIGICAGMIWSEAEAEDALECDVATISKRIRELVNVPLTQGKFDALVDFCYNLGTRALAGSTLLADLEQCRYDDAGLQLLRWDYSGGKHNPGLRARRAAELALWTGKTVQEIEAQAQARMVTA